MGDIVLNAEKKDVGLSSIHVPMLNASNYTVWAMRMKIALKVNKVWEATETSEINEDKNNLAMALIVQAIPEALFLQVGELDTAKKIWDAIKARHIGADRVKEARLQTLMADFDRLKMKDTEKVDEFGGKLAEISAKSAALGVVIEESKMVKKFLSSLPRRKFIQIVASLEQVLDLNTTSFEDIMGRIKAYEERITEEENIEADQSKLLYSNMETQASQTNQNGEYNENFRGRGRGHSRGRGRGRNNGGRDLSQVECFRCDKYGHYASKCPDRLLKLQEAQEGILKDTEEADELMMHEVVYLNEEKVVPSKYEANNGEKDIWYLDNGASNHMSGDQRYFTIIDNSITGKVRFGDDSRIDIKGKGSISFIDMNGESRVMTDVYFIPDLKSNIISLGQATESSCDIRMKGEWLTMRDQKGKLLVKTKRSRNRLYKVCMGIYEVEKAKFEAIKIMNEKLNQQVVKIRSEARLLVYQSAKFFQATILLNESIKHLEDYVFTCCESVDELSKGAPKVEFPKPEDLCLKIKVREKDYKLVSVEFIGTKEKILMLENSSMCLMLDEALKEVKAHKTKETNLDKKPEEEETIISPQVNENVLPIDEQKEKIKTVIEEEKSDDDANIEKPLLEDEEPKSSNVESLVTIESQVEETLKRYDDKKKLEDAYIEHITKLQGENNVVSKVRVLQARGEEREKEIESLLKITNEQRARNVKSLEKLLHEERKAHIAANQRVETLSLELQAAHASVDNLQQELAQTRLKEIALENKVRDASSIRGKRTRNEDDVDIRNQQDNNDEEEMRDLIGMNDLGKNNVKLRRENVGLSLT